ncbi:MAG: Inorganic pyrophosphatase [Erysipelotrichaceae bacterium]|nr:Inorganic pyrophosphatase [Erysipelotrichaceae bacterium]
MKSFENNAFFWQKMDTLFLSTELKVTRQKGERHPIYNNLIYPVDYCHLEGTSGNSESGLICVYKGSIDTNRIDAVVVSVDILKKDMDTKLISGCSEIEEAAVLRFLNQTDFQKTIIVRRGVELPSWAFTE